MSVPPEPPVADVDGVRDLLARARRRLVIRHVLRSLSWGPLAPVALWRSIPRETGDAAKAIEARDERFKNVLITADEILSGVQSAPGYVAQRVVRDAARLGADADVSSLLPLRGVAIVAMLAVVAWIGLAAALPWAVNRAPVENRTNRLATSGVGAWHVSVTVVPPPYTGAAPKTFRDPEQVEAIEGSVMSLVVDSGAPDIRARTTSGVSRMTRSSDGAQTVRVPLSESGFVAVESATVTRLIGVKVVPDHVPNVLVTAPASDLLLPDARRRISLAGAAADDIGLKSLELRYTTISGSGEQFEFREGSLPLTITRENAMSWRAAGELPLLGLGLQPGDTVVYRLVATDGRGAKGIGSSETYMVDIAAPGQATLAGFELPPDRDRQGMSQQMILLKIQKLHARRTSLSADALREEALGIAAEQRTVRATFVFMMGGEVEDEEEEAAHSHEIGEGRLENAARRDMLEAVRHMMQVETQLAVPDTGQAIPPARAAVAALERAFGRRRYFLRTLPVRSRIDPSRRLSGDLTEARDATRPLTPSEENAEARAMREALAELMALATHVSNATAGRAADESRRLARAAERVLALDPSAADLQSASLRLARRASAVSSGAAVDTAAPDVQAALETLLARATRAGHHPQEPAPAAGALKGRWLAALQEQP
jgi:hypothetical protein